MAFENKMQKAQKVIGVDRKLANLYNVKRLAQNDGVFEDIIFFLRTNQNLRKKLLDFGGNLYSGRKIDDLRATAFVTMETRLIKLKGEKHSVVF